MKQGRLGVEPGDHARLANLATHIHHIYSVDDGCWGGSTVISMAGPAAFESHGMVFKLFRRTTQTISCRTLWNIPLVERMNLLRMPLPPKINASTAPSSAWAPLRANLCVAASPSVLQLARNAEVGQLGLEPRNDD